MNRQNNSPSSLMLEFEQALLTLDRVAAKNCFAHFENNEDAVAFVDNVMMPAMERIGKGWEQGDVALSQVYMSGRICEALIDSILPQAQSIRKQHPKMAIAVLEDHHLLGKRLVSTVLRISGFDLLDYGQIQVENLVRRVQDDAIEVLLISVLMLPSALRVKELREQLDQANIDVKIIVGGAPFLLDANLWKEVGADAMGGSAAEAVNIIKRVTGDLS